MAATARLRAALTPLLAGCALAAGCTPGGAGPADSAPPTEDAQPGGMDGAAPPPPADLDLSPDGDDAWSGTLPAPNPARTDGPLATVARAQALLEALRARKPGPLTVILRGGTYYSPATLTFGAADSGSQAAPILWAAWPGEAPVLSGGIRVTGWTPSPNGRWTATLPAGTRPFENLFYGGQRRLRPRVGASDGDLVAPFLRVASEVYAQSPTATCPAQALVQGKGYKCFDRFQYDPADGLSSRWTNLAPPPGNPGGAPAGDPALSGDVELALFEDWTMERMRLSCVDESAHVVYFTAVTPGAQGAQINFFGPVAGHRYVVENVADLLGHPGQWLLDRSSTPFTLSYVANPGEDPNRDVVVAPQAQPIVLADHLRWVTFRGLTFEADDFVPGASGYNHSDNGENGLPGAFDCEGCQDVTLDGVTVRETSASGITIASAKSDAAPAARVTVKGSLVYDVGGAGIHVGRAPAPGDSDANLPQSITIVDNLVQGFSRVFAAGQGISSGSMHDVSIDHNDVTDGYRAGISICEEGCPFGKAGSHGTFNVVSTYNHLWNLMQGITSDGGALYYHLGDATQTALGGRIQHNLVHDVTDSSIIDQGVPGSGYGGDGIYLDNQTGGVDVEWNVVYRVSGYGFHQSKGPAPGMPANTLNNNLVAYPRLGVYDEIQPWPQGCGQASPLRVAVTNNVFYFDRTPQQGFYPVDGCAYSCGLPFDQFQQFAGNLYWRTDGGFASDPRQFHAFPGVPSDVPTCAGANRPADWSFFPLATWQGTLSGGGMSLPLDEDPGAVIADPGFANPVYPGDDFRLGARPVAGFDHTQTNDTLAHAGRTSSTVTVPAVAQTFPTYHYDPKSDY